MRIEFFIPIEAAPKQSFRATSFVSVSGKRITRGYQPSSIVMNASALAILASAHKPAEPMQGPVRLTANFLYRWIKKHGPKQRALGRICRDTKPDLTQLEKQLEDSLERAGWFANDSQIAEKRTGKYWTDRQGIEIVVETIDDVERALRRANIIP